MQGNQAGNKQSSRKRHFFVVLIPQLILTIVFLYQSYHYWDRGEETLVVVCLLGLALLGAIVPFVLYKKRKGKIHIETFVLALLPLLVSVCCGLFYLHKDGRYWFFSSEKEVENEHIVELPPLDGASEELVYAIERSQTYGTEKITESLENGADVNALFPFKFTLNYEYHSFSSVTPLAKAAVYKRVDSMAVLLEHGADANARAEPSGDTPLTLLLVDSYDDDKDIVASGVQMLLDAGADPNLNKYREGESRYADGLSPLQIAVANENLKAVSQLLDAGADPNYKNSEHGKTESAYGSTALLIAAESDHSELLELLLSYGADPNRPSSENGKTRFSGGAFPISIATLLDKYNNVKLLLEAGADPNVSKSITSSDGFTPLTGGVNDARITSLLIDYGANVNLERADGLGITPLITNVALHNKETVEILIERGAEINHISEVGTALDAAIQYEAGKELEELLRAHGGKTEKELKP